MASRSDPESGVAEAATPEARASALRHHLRNKLAAVRNAVFYVKKRVATTDLWQQDPRLPRFFDLIGSELAAAEESIGTFLTVDHLSATAIPMPHGGALPDIERRLLLVDDHEGNRLTVAALLEDEGFAVDVAASCEEAEKRISEADHYAAAIVDVNLGSRSGLELVGTVKGRFPGAKILILTGEAVAVRDAISGVDAVIGKESDFSQWKPRLIELLDGA